MIRRRVIIEVDTFIADNKDWREALRARMAQGYFANAVPGTMVYLATELADEYIISHDGKTPTVG